MNYSITVTDTGYKLVLKHVQCGLQNPSTRS